MPARWAGGSVFPLAVMRRRTPASTWRAPFPTTLLWHGSHRLSPGTGTRLRKHTGAQHVRGNWVYPPPWCYSAVGVTVRGRDPSRLPHVSTAHPTKQPWPVPGRLKAELTTHTATKTAAMSLDGKERPPALSSCMAPASRSVSRASGTTPVPVVASTAMGLAAILARTLPWGEAFREPEVDRSNPPPRRGLCSRATNLGVPQRMWCLLFHRPGRRLAEFLLLSPRLPSLRSPSWCACAWDRLNPMLGIRRWRCPTPPTKPSSGTILAEKRMAG